jgi:xanthine dehydrogenase accessory factor
VYDVALSVLACLRANTDIVVAWIASDELSDGTAAVALTPGGGQIGSLLGGALDNAITHALPTVGDLGGIIAVEIGPAESLITGLPLGTELSIAVVPGTAVPEDTWETFADRKPVNFLFRLDGNRFTGFELIDPSEELGASDDTRLICTYAPVRRVVIVGGGPIADALQQGFELVGWKPMVVPNTGEAGGVTATLSRIDGIVVMGHDVEASGRALQAAIASNAGYIGSLGSKAMQDLREEWLAYRGVKWDDRVHGPAGLLIGASNPSEIAISIVAEAVAASHLDDPLAR